MPERRQRLDVTPGFCATVFADGIGHARHMVAVPTHILTSVEASTLSEVQTFPGLPADCVSK
jgi:hypothetical protein